MRKKIPAPRKACQKNASKRIDQLSTFKETDHTYTLRIDEPSTPKEVDQPSSKPNQTCAAKKIDQPSASKTEQASSPRRIDQPSTSKTEQTCSPRRTDQPSTSQSTDPPEQKSQPSSSPGTELSPKEKRSKMYRTMLSFLKRNQVYRIGSQCMDFNFLYNDVSREFSGYLCFVKSYWKPGKNGLETTIYPLFVHFYLMILHICKENSFLNARAFFTEFYYLFNGVKGYGIPLTQLRSLKSFADVKQHPYFWKFWKNEYIVYLSDSVLRDLEYFISRNEFKTLGFVFRFRFNIKNPDSTNIVHTEETINDVNDRRDESLYLRKSTFNEGIKGAVENAFEKNFPIVSLVVLEYEKSKPLSVDLNKDEDEICIVPGTSSLLVTPLISNPLVDRDDIHIDINDMKKVVFDKTVTFAKYHTRRSQSIFVACGGEINLIDKDLIDEENPWKISRFSQKHKMQVLDMDINPKVDILATASRDRTCKIWNMTTFEEIDTFIGNYASVNVVRFHPNGMYIVTGSTDTTVRLRDIEHTGIFRSFLGHKAEIFSVAITLDGKIIASGDASGIVKFWDIRANSEISEILSGVGEIDPRRKVQLSFSKDNILTFCDNKQIIRIIDIRNPTAKYHAKFLRKTPLLIKYSKYGHIYAFLADVKNKLNL